MRAKAGHLRQRLEGLVGAHPDIFESVRGAGLMLGLAARPPIPTWSRQGYDAGLLTVPAGDNVVRILPALTITEEEIGEGVARLDAAATALERPHSPRNSPLHLSPNTARGEREGGRQPPRSARSRKAPIR